MFLQQVRKQHINLAISFSHQEIEQGVISGKKSSQDIFSDKTMTSLERKWEKQYGIDHREEKHLTKEEGRTCSESENCDSEIEQSEAPFKVEN